MSNPDLIEHAHSRFDLRSLYELDLERAIERRRVVARQQLEEMEAASRGKRKSRKPAGTLEPAYA